MSIYQAVRGTPDAFRSFLESASEYDQRIALSEVANHMELDAEKVEIVFEVLEPKAIAVNAAIRSAAHYAHTELVARLLPMSPRPHKNADALKAAASNGSTEILRMLLEAGSRPRDEIKDMFPRRDGCEDGDHPVLNAIRAGHREALRLLAEHGVSLTFTTKAERSPLDMAKALKPELVPLLEELGARPLGPESMDLLRLVKNGHLGHIPARIPKESPQERHAALLEAVRQDHRDAIALLLETELQQDSRENCMTTAAGAGNVSLMRWLKREYGIKYGSKATYKDWTASHAAAYSNKVEVLQFLIGEKIPMDVGDKDDKLPLHWAALGKADSAVKLLLEHGANPNARDDEGKNALFYVTYYGVSPQSQAAQDACIAMLKGAGTKTKSPASWLRSLKKKLKPHARDAHKLRTKSGMGEPRANRFGGMPFFAEGESWPLNTMGKPLLFIVQLDLSTLPFDAGTGLVRVFVDPDIAYRDEGNVILHTESTEGAMRAAPEGGRILMPRQISGFYKGKPDLPGADVPCGTIDVALDPNETELLPQVCLAGDKAGGWPHWIQDAEWRGTDRLLLQTDTGGALDFSFADSGIGFLLQSSTDPTLLKMVWQTL